MKINFVTSPIRQRIGLLSSLHKNDAASVSLFSYKYLTHLQLFLPQLPISLSLSLSLSLCWTVKTTMSSSEKVVEKMITLVSSDGETFEVEEKVAMESQTLKGMIEDDCADSAIPLPNVASQTLSRVIEYCKKHVEAASESEVATYYSYDKTSNNSLTAWDDEFVKDIKVDQNILFDLILVCFLSFQDDPLDAEKNKWVNSLELWM